MSNYDSSSRHFLPASHRMTKRFSLTTEPIAGCTLLLGAVLYNFHNYSICHFIFVDCQQESTVHPEEKYCLQSLSRAERGKCLLTGTAFLTVNSPRAFKRIKPGSKYLQNQCLDQRAQMVNFALCKHI